MSILVVNMASLTHHNIMLRLVMYLILLSSLVEFTWSLATSSIVSSTSSSSLNLQGDWGSTKTALRSPDCCVVSVPGLESHMKVLQEHWANNKNNNRLPPDLDLRARVCAKSPQSSYKDCLRIRRSVSLYDYEEENEESFDDNDGYIDPCTAALMELAHGVASLADGPKLEGSCTDVFIRIVCASDYKARDPMFHTDKAPLRGYVTLCGVGTEFMTRTCTPLEYAALRTFGVNKEKVSSDGKRLVDGGPMKNLRQAEELEFIVMKGDHYEAPPPPPTASAPSPWIQNMWKRASACVHRSPPGNKILGGRRVIVSLDLADGDDDREWYEANKKREWRSGMTQRKSRLVS
mmetsp:Transcript_17547/g.27101  ORF Transcript_17547/g.27101 Transcript_17547/m.27101 type:complete len:348 (-) Transcript_17547:2567-3610(-)